MSSRKSARKRSTTMPAALPVIEAKVAGIDIGSKEHFVCGPPRADGVANVEVFGSTTPELERMSRWLVEQGVKSVAMESTSVYWIPLYELLVSRGIAVVLANARQLHNVPGRKTDFSDCQWIQLLHSHGLLRGSFRPDDAIVRLRSVHRQLGNLIAERTKCVQWMQKSLDQMNVQVHRAVTDITGTTGMAIVRAIVGGERDARRLAQYRDARCKKSVDEMAAHLTGNWREDHLFNLKQSLKLFDAVEGSIEEYEKELLQRMEALQPPERGTQQVPPHHNRTKEKAMKTHGESELRLTLWRGCGLDLTRIDGIRPAAAQTILTEIGYDLSAFPSVKHWISWLRLCPRQAISGGKPVGKRRNGFGASRIAGALRMCAAALERSRTALGAYFRRVCRRKGRLVAVFATARKLAELIYAMLVRGQDYVDAGEQAYEARFEQRRLAAVTEAARSLGYAMVPAA